MNSDLYNILCENNLAFPPIVVALTSRGIHSVIDFLERGEDALKDMYDDWVAHGQCCLVRPVQCSKLTQLLKTLRDIKK